jgi:hypothetical protein
MLNTLGILGLADNLTDVIEGVGRTVAPAQAA